MRVLVECPVCQESLMDKKHLINDIPSIALICRMPDEKGGAEDMVRLSAFYGDYLNETELDINDGLIGRFFCPNCKTELNTVEKCYVCDAPMVKMQLERGGMLEFCLDAYERRLKKKPEDQSFHGRVIFCARKGCPNHAIDFNNPDASLKEFYDAFGHYLRDV